jgi:hypothetical protein
MCKITAPRRPVSENVELEGNYSSVGTDLQKIVTFNLESLGMDRVVRLASYSGLSLCGMLLG